MDDQFLCMYCSGSHDHPDEFRSDHNHKHHHCERARVELNLDEGSHWFEKSISQGHIHIQNDSSFDVCVVTEIDPNSSRVLSKSDSSEWGFGAGAKVMGTGGELHLGHASKHSFEKRAPVVEKNSTKYIRQDGHTILDCKNHKLIVRIFTFDGRTQISKHDVIHTCNRYRIVDI